MMKRRAFITLLGGAAAGPLTARPPPPPPPVIYIAPTAPPPDTSAATLARWDGAHPQARRAMKTAAMIFALALVGSQALAQEQTRIYGRTAGASARPPLMARSSPPFRMRS